MAVKIRLKRMGKIRAPYYRVVVADSRTKRDGRAIEEIGVYHPTHEPSTIVVDSERAQYWLGVGAQPTEQVMVLLKVTGDWQKFKGLPGAEGTLRFAAPKVDKKAVFEAAAKESMAASSEATTPKAKKKAAPKVEAVAEPTQPTETAVPAEPVVEPVAEVSGADSDEVVADVAPAAEADKAAAEA